MAKHNPKTKPEVTITTFVPKVLKPSDTKVHGDCAYIGVVFDFSANWQAKDGYWRCIIRATDETGKAIQNISADIRIRAKKRSEIEEAIRNATAQLYEKHSGTLRNSENTRLHHISLPDAIAYAHEEFIDQLGGTSSTRDHKSGSLDHIAETFADMNGIPIDQLNEDKVLSAMERDRRSGEDARVARDFVDFLGRKYDIPLTHGNPFEKSFDALCSTKPTPKSLIERSTDTVALSQAQQSSLNENIIDNAANRGLFCGLLLVHICGFTPEEACGLKWGDLTFDSDGQAYLPLIKDYTTYTRDYTRPLLPFAARILSTQLAQVRLVEEHPENLYIVTEDGSFGETKLSKKVLSNFCTAVLRKHKISTEYTDMEGQIHRHTPGARLLRNNYLVRLERDYGLTADPAAAKYLSGKSLSGDVTADNYRKFTADGYLRSVLERAPALPGESIDVPQELTHEVGDDGRHIYSAPPIPEYRYFIDMTFEVSAGELIEFVSRKGLDIVLEVMPV